MSTKTKTVVMRFVRTAVATVVAMAAAWVTGPDVMGLVSDPTVKAIIIGVVAPGLVALNKWLRYGSDAGEDTP